MGPGAAPEFPSAREDVALRRVGSEWVVFDASGERAHVLNPSAAAVWAYCDGAHDAAAIAEAIARDLPTAELTAIRRDVEAVLLRFAAEGLFR
jgi:hypothetical protein